MPDGSADASGLRQRLRKAGIAPKAIRAVWPTWWSEEAQTSRSAVVELHYTIARRLGISPQSLFDDGAPQFLWKDTAKFKNVGAQTEEELAALTSFSVAVGQAVLSGLAGESLELPTPSALRDALLSGGRSVDLRALLDLCWAIGIPVVQLALFPLGRKRMHAVTVRVHGRYAVLVGRESGYGAQVAYIVAHELGHIAHQHLAEASALVEADDPITRDGDDEEHAADSYALELLTGDARTVVEASDPEFTASQLADVALRAAPELAIDPGVLALCLGHSSGRWRQAFGALKVIQRGKQDVGSFINGIARHQLAWPDLTLDTREFLEAALGFNDAAA